MKSEINANQPQGNLPDKINDYAKASLSDNTWKAYEYDLVDFYDWGGDIPCTPDMVASYMVALADIKTVATIKRWRPCIRRIGSKAISRPLNPIW